MSYKILLIDHDESRVERIQRPLAKAGYDVVVASAAEEGLQTFERVHPDLAVIEALLPEKTGSELCQEIKDNPLGKDMPVILVLEAGENQQERARELDLHGCDMLIDDAIPDDDLLNVLGQLLGDKQEQAEEVAEEPVVATPPAPARRPQPDMLLDSYELDSALQKLDSILDKQQAAEEGVAEPPLDKEKVREAEQAGDFSAIAAEMSVGKEKPVEQTDQQAQHEAVIAQAGLLADAGSDIDDRLDSIFSMGEAKPVAAETEAPVKFYEEIEEEVATAEELVTPPVAEMEAEEEPEMVAEPVVEELVEPSLEIDAPEAVEEPVIEEVAEPEPVAAPAESAVRPAPAFVPAEKRGGMKKWWLAAAAVVVISIAAGAIMLLTGDSPPEPIAVTPPPVEGTPIEEGALVASAALVKSPAPEAEKIEVAAPASRQEKPVAKKPEPEPVKIAAAVAKPKPEPVKPEPKVETVKIAPAAVQPKPEPKPEPVKPEPTIETVKIAPAAVEPKPEPKPEPVKPEPKVETVKIAPAAAPAPVVYEPPEIIERVDPVYPPKALKRAAGRTIVLKMLIDENGRIIRVSVEQGVPLPELEAACINAVLRWRYRPAKENGAAVKAWTTAEFPL